MGLSGEIRGCVRLPLQQSSPLRYRPPDGNHVPRTNARSVRRTLENRRVFMHGPGVALVRKELSVNVAPGHVDFAASTEGEPRLHGSKTVTLDDLEKLEVFHFEEQRLGHQCNEAKRLLYANGIRNSLEVDARVLRIEEYDVGHRKVEKR